MTRKRKNADQSEESGGVPTFPKKEYKREAGYDGNDYQSRGDFSKRDRGNWNEGHYGYQKQEYGNQPEKEEEPKVEFPTELVSYLRHFSDLIQAEGVLEDEAYSKCVEECVGSEERLLAYFDACKVVEAIFCSSSSAALLFLKRLFKLKHKKLLDLFFATTAARTIEKLVVACAPITKNEQVEVLTKMTDLLCDNWNDAVTTQSSSFLLRCLARVCCGISQQSDKVSDIKRTQDAHFPSTAVGGELKQLFCHIADLAVDNAVNPASLRNLHCSLVIHDILDCDAAVNTGRCSLFITKQISSGESAVVNALKGKSSSRVWDRAVAGCSEEVRSELWKKVLRSHAEELAMDSTANHPLKNFVANVKSEELADDICEVLRPLIPKLFSEGRPEVVDAIARCAKIGTNLQEGVIKELRAFFNANKASKKEHFLLNVLTMNKYDGSLFDVNQTDIQGSFLLQTLLELDKVKTLSACVLHLNPSTLLSMALHKICAFVIQAVLKSKTVEDSVKNHVISSFNDHWEDLATHPIGSRTFETIWDSPLFTVNQKQTVMKGFVNIRNTSRNWKFTLLRCDMNLFRKDRRAWVAKMKQQK